MATELEKDIERRLKTMVECHGGLCLKWVCPGWAGVPDRIVLLPFGRVVFVELKRPKGGRVAPLQEWWAKQLTRLGFPHAYIYRREDIKTLEQYIEEWSG